MHRGAATNQPHEAQAQTQRRQVTTSSLYRALLPQGILPWCCPPFFFLLTAKNPGRIYSLLLFFFLLAQQSSFASRAANPATQPWAAPLCDSWLGRYEPPDITASNPLNRPLRQPAIKPQSRRPAALPLICWATDNCVRFELEPGSLMEFWSLLPISSSLQLFIRTISSPNSLFNLLSPPALRHQRQTAPGSAIYTSPTWLLPASSSSAMARLSGHSTADTRAAATFP